MDHPTPFRRVVFCFFSTLVFLLMLAVLELNHNTLLSFALASLAALIFWLLYHKWTRRKKWFVKGLFWLVWIGVFIVIVKFTWPPTKAVPAVAGKDPQHTDVRTTAYGDVQGVLTTDGKVEVYAGIPYATPPVGNLRWTEPKDPEPWEGTLQADHFAPMSMQPTHIPLYDSLVQIIGYHDYKISLDDNWVPPVSEDSLYLNIWKPEGDVKDCPVLVFIHGGSLQTGQTWYHDYSGESLAREGVIVVNFAYRLGVFGYLADAELIEESPNGTTGNYGLLDQIQALKWVQENIASFGGDPDQVTIAGESAGAASVSALCVSPLAKGLFQRAILESSTVASPEPPHSFRSMEEAQASGARMKLRLVVSTMYELRRMPAEELLEWVDTEHHMTIDGYALTELPMTSYQNGRFNETAILHGYNSRESASFLLFDRVGRKEYEKRVRNYFGDHADQVLALYPASTDEEAAANWAMIWGAVFFDYPHYCLNRLAVEQGIPVYEYYFTKENGRIGPWHSGEMIYCYGNIPEKSALYDDRDRELSEEMLDYWANFIKTGDPNGEGLPEWKQNTASEDLMQFGETTAMGKEQEHELFAIMDALYDVNGKE